MENKKEVLKVSNLDVYYGNKQIVSSVSTKYFTKDILLLVGPNGAGKSTYLKALSGLLKHRNGKIYLKDEDISNLSLEKRVSKGILHLLQTENVFSNYTVYENLQIAGFFLDKMEFGESIDKVFTLFPHLKDKKNRLAGLLSGGERQALAISMILMKKPKILLLDEPLAGLSPKSAREFIVFLSNVFELFPVEFICFVEHNLKLSFQYSNRVQVLVQGRLIMDEYIHENTNIKELIKQIEKLYFGEEV
ncbi:ATP-binding cassette domain-containing protein [Persephonella sp.]